MTPRRLASSPLVRPLLLWLGIAILLLVVNAGNIATRHFPDPDDTLRLIQVRDLLAGQGWFDLHQYRIDPPAGILMHWSRLVDLPLAALIALLSPALGAANAELATMVAVPLLTLLAIVVVVDRLAMRLFGPFEAVLACLCLALAPLLVAQVQPLRIDHHGWQICAVMAALLGLVPGRGVRGGAAWSGVALACGLSISLEVLPLAAAFGGVFALRWVTGERTPRDLLAYLGALTAGLGALFLATRGLSDLAVHCDAVSPPYLALLAAMTLGAGATAALRPRAWPLVAGLLAVAAVAAVAVFLTLAPACAAGPFEALDPLVHAYWYDNIKEGRPAWESPAVLSAPAIAQGLLGLAVVAHLWRTSARAVREWWLGYGLVTASAFATGLLLWRGMAFVGALGALPIGWLAARLLMRLREAERAVPKFALATALLLVLVPSFPGALLQNVPPAHAAETVTVSNPASEACGLPESAGALSALPPATIFAPMDVGPAVLLVTGHSVVASSHHRAAGAMHDVIAAFTGPQAAAHGLIRRHHADYVMLCTDLTEAQLYANRAPHGLAAELMAGRTPGWLEPVTLEAPAAFRLWKVRG